MKLNVICYFFDHISHCPHLLCLIKFALFENGDVAAHHQHR